MFRQIIWIAVKYFAKFAKDGGANVFDAAKRAKELTRVLEASPDLVAILDPLGREITWANDAIASHLNLKSNEQLLNSLDSWSQAQYATVALPTVRSAGIWRGELRLSTSQDQILPISTLLVAHRNEENQIESTGLQLMGNRFFFASKKFFFLSGPAFIPRPPS